MDSSNMTNSEHIDWLPADTKRATQAMGLLLFFSCLMFTLPFGVYFGANMVLHDYYHIDGFANTAWSVVAAILTVYLIIAVYVYIAYHEPDFDSARHSTQWKDD